MYVLASKQTVTRYPYTADDLRKDHPNTSFPYDLSDCDLSEFNVFPVVPTTPPSYDRLKKKLVEKNPSFANGVWTQVWTLADLSAEEASIAFFKLVSDYEPLVSKRLDDFARTAGYADTLSCCTYATSNIGKYKREGQYMVGVRDQTWFMFYQIMDEARKGTRPTPASFTELAESLPSLAWPT